MIYVNKADPTIINITDASGVVVSYSGSKATEFPAEQWDAHDVQPTVFEVQSEAKSKQRMKAIKKMMFEDGASQEEIEKYMKENP